MGIPPRWHEVEMDKDMENLHQIPLFRGISAKDITPMMKCLGSYERKYQKGEYISLISQRIQCTGVVLKGTVHMVKEDVWGDKTILASIGYGELFGESFVCGDADTSSVSILSKTDTRILFLPFDRVMHSCSESCEFHHRLIENMVKVIANKNVQLMEKLEIVSKKSLREKIETYLSIEAGYNRSRYFQIPMGRTELAEYLCADRSALTRELNNMKKDGVIDFDKNTFRLLERV